jgi:hypothetical protein
MCPDIAGLARVLQSSGSALCRAAVSAAAEWALAKRQSVGARSEWWTRRRAQCQQGDTRAKERWRRANRPAYSQQPSVRV